MRQWLTVTMLALALMAVGCAAGQKQTVSGDTKVKCPKCGVEFTVEEGMQSGK